MADLKLPKLPDRTPVKLTISVPPDVHIQLGEYLAQYHAAYGDDGASLADLVPAMLEAFLRADKAFQRERSQPIAARKHPQAQ